MGNTRYYVPLSAYYSAWYYPSVRGPLVTAGTYGILRFDAGVNLRVNLTSPFSVKGGLQDEVWVAKNAWASNTNFFGPYVGLSWWH